MRTALVTGGTGAIGSAVVRALRAEGVPTWFTWSTSEGAAAALATTTGATPLRLDLREPAAVRALVAGLATAGVHPDAWVQAAGVRSDAAFDVVTDAQRATAWGVHVDGPAALLQALAPGMATRGDVVLVGALDRGQSAGLPVHLAAAQGGAAALAMAAAHALGPAVRVNVVTVGLLAEGMGAEVAPELRAQYRKFSSLRREGSADEVAAVVTWLLLNNTYMSGKTLAANGGI